MFVKYTKSGNYTYVQLVQSYRDSRGKSRHKVIANLGRKDTLIDKGIVDKVIRSLSKLSKELVILDKAEFNAESKILGPILAIESAWKRLKLGSRLTEISDKYKFRFDFNKAVKLMVINRLIDPKSKLALDDWKGKLHFNWEDIKLENLYRSLDVLADNKENLEASLYDTSLTLFKPDIKLVFYDLTTAYFESQAPDDLRKFGYSKDNKTDCTQVVIGMVLSKDGLPLGYELFPGNQNEGKTVMKMLDKLHLRYKIGKLVFVGDRGLLSEKVLKDIEEAGYEYIVAAKVKSLPKKYHEKILGRSHYRQVGEELWLSEMEIKGKRLVLGYNGVRAKRDKMMRDEIIRKLKKKAGNDSPKKMMSSQYSRFLKVGRAKVELDDARIELDSRWDGFFGYYTNNQTLKQEEVLESYRLLWQVEDSFRHLKSTLSLRPMFHWSEKRIQGHIMMCFLSFYILRIFERGLREKGLDISVKRALEEITEIRSIEVRDKNRIYTARTNIEGLKTKILRAFHSHIPKTILDEQVVA